MSTQQEHPSVESRHPSRSLNLSNAELARAGGLLTDLLQQLEASLAQRPVVPNVNREQLSGLLSEPFSEAGSDITSLFSDLEARVLPNCTAIPHPRFLAYVLGPPNGFAPFADAIAATINQNCNFWQLSPAASVIEQKVITWLMSLFDYPESAGGILTSGGRWPHSWRYRPLYNAIPASTFGEPGFLD